MADEDRRLFQYEAGKPVGFYLHPSIKNEYQKETLTNNILAYGGKVLDSPSGADTVLVDEKKLRGTRETLQTTYSVSRDAAFREIVVEPMRFVQDCIRRKVFTHAMPGRRGMGGYVGRTRTDFTKQDDDNLCWFISRKIPNPTDGGRVSLGVYKELLLAAEYDESLAWAKRHTAESWRERYKKNRERLDPIIVKYATQYPPEPPALYNLSRRFNKNPKRALKFTERFDDDIIELTDNSEEDRDVDVKPQRRSRSLEKDANPSKRRRIDSSDLSSPHKTPSRDHHIRPSSADRTHIGSSPLNKGKGKAVNRGTTEPEEHESFDFAPLPVPDLFAPGPSQPKQPLRSQPASEPRQNVQETPAPSPTLVRRSSPVAMLPPPLSISPRLMRVNAPILPSPHPSTSFRNVAHSSPIYAPTLANRSGLRSNDTSTTEPSSRSIVVPPEFAPSVNAINAPAESSITRESSHKRSSPVPPPMRKASRKQASRQPPVPPPVGDGEGDQGRGRQQQQTQWAPYKNTRSRSRSVEPVLPPGTRKRKERNLNVPRNVLLAPVHEGEADQEHEHEEANSPEVGGEGQEEHQVISTTLTETIQEERSVANLLMLDSHNTSGISGTVPRASNRTDRESGNEENGSEEETEEEGEGEKLVVEKKEEEENDEGEEENGEEAEEGRERVNIDYESEQDDESGAEETPKFETAPEVKMQSYAPNSDGENDDVSSISSDLEDAPSTPEDEGSIQDIPSIPSSDVGTLSRASSNSPRPQRPFLDNDDAEIDQMLTSPSTAHDTPGKTAREVLALYDSSPEVDSSLRRRKRKPFNKFRDGSPSPLRTQNQNRPRSQESSSPEHMLIADPGATILTRTATGREATKRTPVQQVTQRLTGSARRVSYGLVTSAPLSGGSLPRTPVGFIRSQPGGSQSRSSLRNSFPQSQLQSQLGRPRHNSLESTSSEMASFPINGTRASAVKQQVEQEMKNSPYTPPSGTKAAELVAQRLRPRKRG